MKSIELKSCIAKQINQFIEIKRLSGSSYNSQVLLLKYFDRFLAKKRFNNKFLTKEIIEDYQLYISSLQPRTQGNHMSVVRLLCRYISSTKPETYLPEPMNKKYYKNNYKPYIFNTSEIQMLLTESLKLKLSYSLRPFLYYTLFGLLYTTGLRINEALSLTIKDFFSKERMLFIAEGKFRKSRWIPLHQSTNQILKTYVNKREKINPCLPDEPFFINRSVKKLPYSNVHLAFHTLLRKCNLMHTRVRIHDIRHSFAVTRLLGWYKEKKNVNTMLRVLPAGLRNLNYFWSAEDICA
ncbi:tyrosine-type recombinase/integrase, partial [bacterium]|nr:tyrosine-type recombinase/integrase [bacterium]